MLLRTEDKIVGRFDGRIIGEDANRLRLTPDFDPSLSGVISGYASAVNHYIRTDLGYESDHPYRVLTPLDWRYSSFANRYVAMEPRLANAMKQNSRLRVLVLTSWRDLAVPADAMLYSMQHLPIPVSREANITYAEYDSGHMMYHHRPDAEKLRRDLLGFLQRASK
jgi:carboxypeptidase C (cathepsin A)